MGFDTYYFGIFLMIPVLLLSLIVQARLKATYFKFSRIGNGKRMTGAQIASEILRNANITDVQIGCVSGQMSDHYDPVNKTLNLSEEVYTGESVAAIGIAAHECGHAIQHAEGYAPVRLRSAIVGLTNFSSKLLYFLIIGSAFLSYSAGNAVGTTLFNLAVLCYLVLFLFQMITLPVEFNASARAINRIRSMGFSDEAVNGTKKVLSAAAMTYVASAVTVLWQLLIMMNRSKRR